MFRSLCWSLRPRIFVLFSLHISNHIAMKKRFNASGIRKLFVLMNSVWYWRTLSTNSTLQTRRPSSTSSRIGSSFLSDCRIVIRAVEQSGKPHACGSWRTGPAAAFRARLLRHGQGANDSILWQFGPTTPIHLEACLSEYGRETSIDFTPAARSNGYVRASSITYFGRYLFLVVLAT